MGFLQVEHEIDQTITVVGGGISGLMTAWHAAKAGMKVTIYSRSPDPRAIHDLFIEHGSSTFDSKNDQRFITLFEGHPYLELTGYVDKAYPGLAEDFCKDVLHGGFLVVKAIEFDVDSNQWINDRNTINQELAAHNPEKVNKIQDLFASYTRENRAAMARWYNILTESIKSEPELVEDLALNHNGLLLIFDDGEMYEVAKSSRKENGVLKQSLRLEEFLTAYPAYLEGVERGFIKGGAIETYGIAFGIQTFGKFLINSMEKMGVSIYFNHEVTEIIKDEDVVKGIFINGSDVMVQSDYYVFHTGAFAGPELFKNIPEAEKKLAAVEGYWITIENADRLIDAMGNKPSKVHGKKTLSAILDKIDSVSAENYRIRFQNCGLSEDQLATAATIIDFNIMPIQKNDKVSLGVSSGYIFKGVAQRDETGKINFINNEISELYILTVMELWLEALYGKKLLTEGTKIIIHPKGCKRSWTPSDQELDINFPTISGGLCMIYDGGNTGSATKSPFIAEYTLQKNRGAKNNKQNFLDIRNSLGKTAEEIGVDQWEELTQNLDIVVEKAKKNPFA
jgi:hypothetical protein